MKSALAGGFRIFWRHGLSVLLLGVIVYQLTTTWIPLWLSAGELEGREVSSLTVIDSDGRRISLGTFRGAPLIINFWASWCIPCRAEIPLLASVYPELREQGKELLGVNLREKWKVINEYRAEVDMPFPVYRDDGTLAQSLGIGIIPALVIIDAKGLVKTITYGFRPWVKWYLEWWI